MTQGRDDCGSGQVDSSVCSEKWLYSRYVLKIASERFAHQTGIIHKREIGLFLLFQDLWSKHLEEWSFSRLRW